MDTRTRIHWRPNKRDFLFLGIIAVVITLLVLGTKERTTKPVPNDDVHINSTTRAACMTCHGEQGIRPQPPGHTKADQCFQCHRQPADWRGASK
ncbi:MAG: hypothetical protein D6703_02210 [Zetaproteobacteria bacterium]|nr:MAG: hypothetical protein D6703_02210 [Zetaproteobacteria bacterium]